MEALSNYNEEAILTVKINKKNLKDFLQLLGFLNFKVEIEETSNLDAEMRHLLSRFVVEAPPLPLEEDELMKVILAETKVARKEQMTKLHTTK